MKTKLLSLLALVALLAFSSCSYDDSDLQNRVEQLEQDMTELQQLVSQMNTNLQALQTTVDVLNSGDYITNIAPVTSDGETIGYTLSFGKNDPITIYHGTDGSTPAMSVAVGDDGQYYWTVNGEILKDAQNNPVSAAGVAPTLRINDGVWQYSINNGQTWTNIAISGYAGVIFKSVEVGENSVKIELGDGTTFEIPLMSEFKLLVDQNYYYLENEGVITVNYTIEGSDDMTSVIAFPSGDVTAVVTKDGNSKGSIKITKGADVNGDVQVLVMASNGKGQKDYQILKFADIQLTVTSVDVAFTNAAGTQEVEISSNVEYTIALSEEASWLTYEVAEVKSSYTNAKLTFTVEANPLRRVRSVDIQMIDKYGNVIKAINVAQAAADYKAGGQIEDIPVLPA